jgi:hypothetical protein
LTEPTISVVDEKDSDGLFLQVLPDGQMLCYLDGQVLDPVPSKAKEWAVINLAREEMPPGTPDSVLKRVGLQRLLEAAPAQFELPYAAIKQEPN